MYKLTNTKTGAVIGMTEAPTYIKLSKSGCYILCNEAAAQGVAYNGTPYHLLGRPAMKGTKTVSLDVLDAGEELSRTAGRLVEVEDALCELDTLLNA